MSGHTVGMDHVPLAQALAARLRSQGTPEHIARLFAQVPRHRFLPDTVWGEDRTRYDRAADPAEWMRVAYTDQALTTQRDDGAPGGMGVPTSSSSAPSVMARMLAAAGIESAHRVLEIGTGTGYNAALLSQLLGSGSVATVEIDPELAGAARAALSAAGFHPDVRTGDGERTGGLPSYDRLIATCTVSEVPAAWLRHMRGRGRIVTPWAPTPGLPGGVLAVLDATRNHAQGRFEGGLSFMWARGQRRPGRSAPGPEAVADSTEQVPGDPREPWLDGERALLLSLLMPGWSYGLRMGEDATDPCVWLASTTCSSWARLHADGRVEQGGTRALFEEADRAWRIWEGWNRPAVSDFGLTVDPDRQTQTVWVHGPRHSLWSVRG
ncbi:protein-L-isoaspartate O-methyltransferase [Nocardiopsis terrae]|uniref:Protein-L-isoaspartate O-methyltransferase n=1 Tax=Nocardiopsis terrae TaxID=372655 RepID=A0ABR9HB57_9ACTN|nr:methyltransferase domain-containing protein [Nocardiopsis terrae]MBE1456030.1 protein-L-isoaspartate O-methyltransferase [Nocardiopsis terrae]GHC96220.1 protein-L-isoaspartate O-methyltransferase [Nocardiopsis terrae]